MKSSSYPSVNLTHFYTLAPPENMAEWREFHPTGREIEKEVLSISGEGLITFPISSFHEVQVQGLLLVLTADVTKMVNNC